MLTYKTRTMNLMGIMLILAVCCLWSANVAAQELTPRLYWPAPKGTKVFVSGYAYSYGDVLVDRSLPISGVDSRINSGVLAYMQSLGLWGRSTNLLVELPYSWGKTKGFVYGVPAKRDFAGPGDLGVTLTVNLLGAPSMTREDFLKLRANPHLILAASLKIIAPTGKYDEDRLINVGANRWATRAQLGSIIPLHPTWLLELSASAWFFGDDDEYLTGKREQAPIYGAQVNLIKRLRPGLWASLDLSAFRGGRQTIDGNSLDDEQRNVKIGGTMVIPFLQRHAIKFGYATGTVTKHGNDFNQFLLSYQMVFK